MFLPRRKFTVVALACFATLSLWYFKYLQPTLAPFLPSHDPQQQLSNVPPATGPGAPVAPPSKPLVQEPIVDHVEPNSEHYPVKSLIPLPTNAPVFIPKIQHTFDSEAQEDKAERENRLAAVKESFVRSWGAYKKYAWKQDELAPIRGGHSTIWGGWGATLVDSLDTLWLMGLKEDYEDAVKAVDEIDFSTIQSDQLNVFETTIRYLGGFLGAYDLSGGKHSILLKKAKDLGDLLYGAFDTPNRMPVTRWQWEEWRKGAKQEAHESSLVAEVGSLTLEFTRLAQLTGDAKFYDAIQRITDVLDREQNQTALPGLWPVIMDAKAGKFKDVGFTLGGMADSTYEYLPKQHMLLGGTNPQYKKMYEATMTPVQKHIFFRPMTPDNADILFPTGIRVNINADKIKPDYTIQHLGCFTGGMVGIGAKIFDRPDDLRTARQLVDGCIWAYNHTQNGIMPEIFAMAACEDEHCKWDEEKWLKAVATGYDKIDRFTEGMSDEDKGRWIAEDQRYPEGFTSLSDSRYILRPEAIESVFIFYRMTGEKQYQDAAWRMFQAIEKCTRTDIANAAIDDVTAKHPKKDDRMESFWMAETLKYFYAIFADPQVLSLDDYVLNTEAHAFKRPKAT
ncbi:MAG: hypothetical protein LQ352_004392 [Teloschistes flavicans]|nr:MAG: hypothetical protein LQ352_004392 [Teloschistes flavicans]